MGKLKPGERFMARAVSANGRFVAFRLPPQLAVLVVGRENRVVRRLDDKVEIQDPSRVSDDGLTALAYHGAQGRRILAVEKSPSGETRGAW